MSTRCDSALPSTQVEMCRAFWLECRLTAGSRRHRILPALPLSLISSMRNIMLVAAIGSMIPVIANAADMYRWNDDNGNPVLSDRPPPTGTPYTVIDVDRYGNKANAVKPTSRSEDDIGASPNSMLSDTGGPSTLQSTAKVRVEKRPELCEQASDTIFKLETFARIRTTDANGEVRFMTENERSEQLEIARDVAQANC